MRIATNEEYDPKNRTHVLIDANHPLARLIASGVRVPQNTYREYVDKVIAKNKELAGLYKKIEAEIHKLNAEYAAGVERVQRSVGPKKARENDPEATHPTPPELEKIRALLNWYNQQKKSRTAGLLRKAGDLELELRKEESIKYADNLKQAQQLIDELSRLSRDTVLFAGSGMSEASLRQLVETANRNYDRIVRLSQKSGGGLQMQNVQERLTEQGKQLVEQEKENLHKLEEISKNAAQARVLQAQARHLWDYYQVLLDRAMLAEGKGNEEKGRRLRADAKDVFDQNQKLMNEAAPFAERSDEVTRLKVLSELGLIRQQMQSPDVKMTETVRIKQIEGDAAGDIPFLSGQHKGQKIGNVPIDYLLWIVEGAEIKELTRNVVVILRDNRREIPALAVHDPKSRYKALLYYEVPDGKGGVRRVEKGEVVVAKDVTADDVTKGRSPSFVYEERSRIAQFGDYILNAVREYLNNTAEGRLRVARYEHEKDDDRHELGATGKNLTGTEALLADEARHSKEVAINPALAGLRETPQFAEEVFQKERTGSHPKFAEDYRAPEDIEAIDRLDEEHFLGVLRPYLFHLRGLPRDELLLRLSSAVGRPGFFDTRPLTAEEHRTGRASPERVKTRLVRFYQLLREHDPEWRPSDPNWYNLQSEGPWHAFQELSEEIDNLGRNENEVTGEVDPERLQKLHADIRRLMFLKGAEDMEEDEAGVPEVHNLGFELLRQLDARLEVLGLARKARYNEQGYEVGIDVVDEKGRHVVENPSTPEPNAPFLDQPPASEEELYRRQNAEYEREVPKNEPDEKAVMGLAAGDALDRQLANLRQLGGNQPQE